MPRDPVECLFVIKPQAQLFSRALLSNTHSASERSHSA